MDILKSLLLVLAMQGLDAFADEPTRFVLPTPKEVKALSGSFYFSAATRVEARGEANDLDRFSAKLIRDEFGKIKGSHSARVMLQKLKSWSGRDLGSEGYVLDVNPSQVRIEATTSDGLYYGVQTLLQMIEKDHIPAARVIDWPDVRERMVLYDFRYDNVDVEYTKRFIQELSRHKINQFMFFLSGDYVFEKYPFIASPKKLTREKIQELEKFARLYHVKLFPQLESVGHADGVLKHPQFKNMRLGGENTYAYSPCTEKTYSLLADLYADLSSQFYDTDLFHIGGDEVWNFEQDPRCQEFLAQNSPEALYSRHIERLAGLLKPLGRRIAIWSDMLLQHPKTLTNLDRNTVIFDWHYSEDHKTFDDFPSLRFFKDQGFQHIYATPAILGFQDLYPILPTAFQNVRGLTQAALRENITSVCVTFWEMQPGNSAENYLYGLVWAGQIMWSSQATDLRDFNRRFASSWFGIHDDRADALLDQAMWFPWRISGSSVVNERDTNGFWQEQFLSGHLLYLDLIDFASERSNEEIEAMAKSSDDLLHRLDVVQEAVRWLEQKQSRNHMTLTSLQMTNAFYRFVAHKTGALARLVRDYNAAFAIDDHKKLERSLTLGIGEIRELKLDLPELKKHLEFAASDRNRDVQFEFEALEASAKSIDRFVESLEKARELILGHGHAPKPETLHLAPKRQANM